MRILTVKVSLIKYKTHKLFIRSLVNEELPFVIKIIFYLL